MKTVACVIMLILTVKAAKTQDIIPFDTANWAINSVGHIIEEIEGQQAIYLHNGSIFLKDRNFLNGTIEYDIRLTDRRGFYGIRFRVSDALNGEEFYFRPHQSGNPDANQASPIVNGLAGWQMYFGPAYSFAYQYPFDKWMHVKIVVKDQQAQIYLDHALKPNLSWRLKQKQESGALGLYGNLAPVHYANFSFQPDVGEIVDFEVLESPVIQDIITSWDVSDKFNEEALEDLSQIPALIQSRTWKETVQVEENSVANLAWVATRYDGTDDNTVFARITIQSDTDQIKQFDFGYSDRVIALLNGIPIYRGTNKFRTRDYRYLGTVGLFDTIYLPLKKGDNTLILAVSEDFGGWAVTGKFRNQKGITIQ